MSDLESIRARLRPTFRPFVVRTADGRSLEVPEYNAIAIGRQVVSIVDRADRVHDLRPHNIVSVSDLEIDS